MVVVAVWLVVAAACTKDAGGPVGPNATAAQGTTASSGPARRGTVAKYAGFDSPMYAKGENWLCGPGIATDDRCLRADLDRTVVKADGTTEVKQSPPAADAAFDCFYVYPTVNLTTGPGNDESMAADTAVEDVVVRAQAARFREVCRLYAPLYRQSTLSGYASPDRDKIQAMAYGDVRDAFRYYMSRYNQGRPVLLIGHSQGSGQLQQLLTDEFDNDAELRGKLVSAMLLGGFANVATGQDRGGSFANIPACTAPTQTACVIGFNSTAADTPPADTKRWGGAPDGTQRLCTNPGALGGGAAPIDPILADQANTYTTPWVEYPGALTAECKTVDGSTNLLITATPGDPRDLSASIKNVPSWGLHINEVNLTHGNLIDVARQQGAAAV